MSPRLRALCALLPLSVLAGCPDETVQIAFGPCQINPNTPGCPDADLDGWSDLDIGLGDGIPTGEVGPLDDTGQQPEAFVVPDADNPDALQPDGVVVFPPDALDDGGGVTDPDGGSPEDGATPSDVPPPPPCEPGLALCEGDTAVACVEGGLQVTNCAQLDQVCLDGVCADPGCVPQCNGNSCGPDGCGGECGTCASGDICQSGQCVPEVADGTTCNAIVACAAACAGSASCVTGCIAAGSSAAQAQHAAWTSCVAACNATAGCVPQTTCAQEAALCAFGASGAADCHGVFTCMSGCAGDAACQTSCGASGSPAAQGAYFEYQWCVQQACPNDDPTCDEWAFTTIGGPCDAFVQMCLCDGDDCVTATCTADCTGKTCGDDGCGGTCGTCSGTEACVDDQCVSAPAGLTCLEINTCVGGCNGDATCAQACVAQGSTVAQNQVVALSTCSAGCNGAQGCLLSNACADEYVACVNPTGSAGCQATVQCAAGCSGDPSCVFDCLGQASIDQLEAYYELNWCLADACPNGGQACAQAAASGVCAAYLSACQ